MKILMIGCRWFLDDYPEVDSIPFDEQIQIAGKNSGNLFIGEAVRSHLKRLFPNITRLDYFSFSDIRLTSGVSIRSDYDYIVMSASNMLNPGVNFGFITKFVEDAGLPFVVVGLGAQAESLGDAVDLHPATVRLVEYAAANSKGVGVRGAFTADLLAKLGITNVTVTGCPTAYLNTGKNFSIEVPNSVDDIERAALSYKRDRNKYEADALLKPIQIEMMKLALQKGYDYIAQANFAESWIGFHREIDEKKFANIRKYFGIGPLRAEKLRNYAENHMRIFFKWADWRAHVETMDFAFGCRFHGNMMAMIAGVPAVWYVHDTRTQELCERLSLPTISVHEMAETGFSLERVLEKANYSTFNATYQDRCDEFDAFFTSHFQ
ncbi:polysaccharide pyruvyl transferase family protein [Celeribacter sp. PS-C1]|uniref:polysaccharide pyruvyl transferase family protein n=1 Tax=Celeribacter sp. PS-C1 TaxID=2820813 RepID=UPI001C66341C|nr:polysaccharide pyruvyl transferase family protein [Celeribacter sp. PS-C1]